jgi:hypothetical protein
LGLVGAILQGQPRFTPGKGANGEPGKSTKDDDLASGRSGHGEHLDYDPKDGGFVALLTGRVGERRVVSLKLLVPLSRDGGERTLPLNCPRALTSNLTLTVDTPVIEATTSSGTLLAQERVEHGGTRLAAAGMVGPFRLTWQTGENGARELASVLSCESAIRVSIDGRSVRTDARLSVQSYGGSFEKFRVGLPAGAQLVRDRTAEREAPRAAYQLTVEGESSGGARGAGDAEVARGDDRQIVLVEFNEPQQGPVYVDLSTEQPIGPQSGRSSVELAGFDVHGAVRQFGDVAVVVADDWQARWNIGPNVRQVDASELDASLQQSGLRGAFQFDRQPWSLGVRIGTRKLRTQVTPQYELECSPEEARLTVQLTYQVFGARAFEFRIDMAEWELAGDAVETGGLVDQERILLDSDGALVLPLAQPSSRRAEISFSARRALPRDAPIELSLPVPVADSVGAGELVVRASGEVELRPDLENSRGLTSAAPEGGVSGSSEYRFRTLLPQVTLAAEMARRAREVSTEIATQIEVTQSAALVDERIAYRVRHQPIHDLVFDVGDDLAPHQQQVAISLVSVSAGDDEESDERETPLSFAPLDGAEDAPAPGDVRKWRVSLPQPRSGNFAVRMRYQVPRPDKLFSGSTWELPLVSPADGELDAARAFVRAPGGVALSVDADAGNSSWRPVTDDSETHAAEGASTWIADRSEISLPLAFSAANLNHPEETIVDRVWLQTWLWRDIRQDRAAFRFRTGSSQATVELPPRMTSNEFEVLVGGQPAKVLSRAAGRIVVELAPPAGERADGADLDATTYTLELRSRQPIGKALVTRYRLTPPQIVGTAAMAQMYWHLVLPGDIHVVRAPERLVSASQWQWLGSFWGRQPVLSQPALEQWANASTQLAPAAGHNEYLFTGPAPVLSIELVTAPRWLIVLAASATALAVVLFWTYVRSARRAWVVLAVGAAIAGLAVAFPIPAMLLAQASILGAVIATLSVFVAWWSERPARWPVRVSSGSSQRQLTPRGDSIVMPPVAATASTAPTALRLNSDDE